MTDANAYDPSTWGDDEHAANEALYEPGAPLGSDVDAPPGIDRAALKVEWGELRLALEGAERKLDKLTAFVVAGEAETNRLRARLAEINAELES
jgi:hypothetical protein